jgi:hypothetical protein
MNTTHKSEYQLSPFKHNIPYKEDIYTEYSHKSTVMIINVVNIRDQQCQTTLKNDTKNFNFIVWYDEETGNTAHNVLLWLHCYSGHF